MAIKFLRCRRIDNHEIEADIAESALQHLTGWEPIPEEQEVQSTAEPSGEEPKPAPDPDDSTPDGEASARSTTRKSRSRAATQE